MNLPAHRADLTPVSPADDGRVVGFAYDTLPADDARELRAVTDRMRDRVKANEIENGRDLLAVKDRLAGTVGAFGAWLHAEFGMSERTAQNYMATAREFGDHPLVVAVLPPGTFYKLAAPSTPETIRQDVIRRIEEGERPEPAKILSTISEAKQADRDRRDAERKAQAQSDRRGRQGRLSPEAQAEWDQKEAQRQKRRDSKSAKDNAKAEAERKSIENAAEEVALTIADRLSAEDLAGVLASSEGHWVWSKVRDVLMTLSKQPTERKAAAA